MRYFQWIKIIYICGTYYILTDYNYRTSLQRNHLREIPTTNPGNAESLWPVGVFLPPTDINDLGYSWHEVQRGLPDFYKLEGKSIFSPTISANKISLIR